MVYSLTRGVSGSDDRLHYSLYGGVEHYPDHASTWKEIAPLVAIPVVVIAILTALLSFRIPNITPTTGGTASAQAGGHTSFSLVASPAGGSAAGKHGGSAPATSTPGTSAAVAPTTATGPISSAAAATYTAAAPAVLAPIGSDNGQGLIGGMGGGGSTVPTSTTSPVPVPSSPTPVSAPTTSTTVSDPTNTVQANATVSGTTAQAGVDVTSPLTSKPLVSSSTTIDP